MGNKTGKPDVSKSTVPVEETIEKAVVQPGEVEPEAEVGNGDDESGKILADHLDYAPFPIVRELAVDNGVASLRNFCLKHLNSQQIQHSYSKTYDICPACGDNEKFHERNRSRINRSCSCSIGIDDDDIEPETATFSWKSFFKKTETLKQETLDISRINHTSARIDFSVDLLKEAKGYVLLQKALKSRQELKDEKFVRQVMRKCSKFLELKSVHQDKVLIPSLDVLAVWSSLLIRNDKYATLLGYAGELVDHEELNVISFSGNPVWSSKTDIESLMQETQRLWKERFHEEFPYEWEEICENLGWRSTHEAKAAEVLDAWNVRVVLDPKDIVKDLEWYDELETAVQSRYGCSPDDESFLRNRLKDYEKWFYACWKLQSEEMKGEDSFPEVVVERYLTIDIDLFWHTHLIFPKAYERDCRRFIGRVLIHNPWPTESEDDANSQGRQLFDEFCKKQGVELGLQ
jgi:hypothetical protein